MISAAGRTRIVAALLLAATVGLASRAGAVEPAPNNPIPPDLYGTYGPGGNCTRSPRVSIDATGLYLVSGNTRGRAPRIDMCFSCAGGDKYEGIEIWISPMVGDLYSTHFRFNADEKRGALVVEASGDVKLGPNLSAIVANSPYRKCGPPTQAARKQ